MVLCMTLAACGNFGPMAAPQRVARPAREPLTLDPDMHTIKVYWVGHATALIRLDDRWILTDPNFSDRIAVIERRRIAPGVSMKDLPPIDWVLISHAHVDHLDIPSLSRLGSAARLIVPPGVASYLPRALPFAFIMGLHTWRTVERDGVRITAVPARHSDGRFIVDSLWNRDAHTGYVIQYGPLTVFFAGDTGYHPRWFKEVARHFDIDVALIPVGPAARPGWFHALRKHVHASPAEAMAIFDDLDAQWMVPIHYGTFFKRSQAEFDDIVGAIRGHVLGHRVRMIPVGGTATFWY